LKSKLHSNNKITMFNIFPKANNTTDTYEHLERDVLEKQSIIDQKNQVIKHLKKQIVSLENGPEEHHILGKLIHERPDGVKMYASSCRKLFSNTRSWEFNRPLDKEHVKELQQIISHKQCLEGHLDILWNRNELCIVNGQHRYEAMYDLMELDIDFNREIIVNVHEVDSFNSNESNQIFIATNNIKNVKMKDNPQVKFQNICNRLKDKFPKGISNNPKRGKGTGHRLDKKELYNLIMYNDYFNNHENSEDKIFEEIVQLNSKESLKSFDDFFPRKRAEKWKKQWDGAHESKFFLGLLNMNQLAILFSSTFK
jgi:hypothetical protein